MHKSFDTLYIILFSFLLGFACCDIFNSKQIEKKVINKQTQIQNILGQKSKKDSITEAKPNTKLQELMDFEQMDKKFYTYLQNCEPLNIKSKNGYIEYIIEGVFDNTCYFKHRQIGFMDTICNLPMNITKKYSIEGLKISKQIEELRIQNKTGFVNTGEFINKINNDKNYCKYKYYHSK